MVNENFGLSIKKNKWVEFGGSTIDQGFVLFRLLPIEKIKDENISIIGPDINNLKNGSKHLIGLLIDVGGAQLVKDIEASLEARIFELLLFIKGVYAKGTRALWIRVDKSKIKSFENIGKILNRLYKKEIPKIERIQITFFIDKADPIN